MAHWQRKFGQSVSPWHGRPRSIVQVNAAPGIGIKHPKSGNWAYRILDRDVGGA